MASERSKWLKFLGVLFGVAVVLTFASLGVKAADGNSTEDLDATREYYNQLKDEAAGLDKEIKALDNQIATGKNTAAAKQQQLRLNNQKADLLEEQIGVKQQEIDLQIAAIEQQQRDIELTQQHYDDNFALYTDRLVAIYKMNNAGVLSTLLSINSYSELLSVGRNLQLISQHDTQLLADIEQTKTNLQAQKLELEAMLADLEQSRTQLGEDLDNLQTLNGQLGKQITDDLAAIALNEQELADLKRERAAMQQEMDSVFANLADSTEDFFGGDLAWPVPGREGSAYITSWFGPRVLNGVSEIHAGLDIAGNAYGLPIVAALDGEVVYASTANATGGYGYYLIIDHGGGVRTLYAHCDSISVSVGTRVTQGTQVATVGNTGYSTGPHLHFELRLNNTEKVDPYPYLTGERSLY